MLTGVLGLLLLILLGGLAWQQLWKNSEYESLERRQTLRRILQPGPRGRILDRNGVPLVENRAHYSVVLYVDEMRKEFSEEFIRLRKVWLAHDNDDTSEARPTLDRNKLYREACANVAKHYLDQANILLGRQEKFDEKAFTQHVEQKPLLPFTLISDLTPTEFARLNEEVPVASPMQTRVDARRYYPYGSLAFHTLGWVRSSDEYDDEEWQVEDLSKHSTFPYRGMTGAGGLESLHNDILTGNPGGEIWIVDPANSRFERKQEKTPEPGQDFQCSLDVNLQLVAEKKLAENQGMPGSAIALDVRTGEVLVLASKPDFDLNETSPSFSQKLSGELNASDGWLCRPLQGVYPPGSTFKLITTIAALRNGILDGVKTLDCPGKINFGGRDFKDDTYDINPEGYGQLDVVHALARSNDVFYYQVGQQLKWEALNKEAANFGLGQQTGIGLAEAPTNELLVPSPVVRKKRHPLEPSWNVGNDVTFAVGQDDLQVTPMEMACLIASIARDETRTHPTLVHNPNLAPDTVIHAGNPIGLSPELRQVLLDGMEKVVSDQQIGTGRFAQIPGIRIAGKTGTAQWGGAKNQRHMAWFVCFAPVENPRIAVAVAVESINPEKEYYGGRIALPVAKAILEEYFKRYPLKAN